MNSFITRKTMLLWLLVTAFVAINSCKLKDVRSDRSKGDSAEGLILRESVVFKRSEDRLSGSLSFTARVSIHCEIYYWTKDPNLEPTENAPAVKTCNNQGGATEISEEISPLQSEATYSFRVIIWPPNSTKELGKAFRVEEGDGKGDIVSDQLVIARVVVPQNSVEIYTHKLGRPLSVANIRKTWIPNLGCTNSAPSDPNPFSQATPKLELESVSTEGYATASIESHPGYSNRLIQTYGLLQQQLNWRWSYRWQGKELEFSGRPPARLTSIRLVSQNKDNLAGEDLSVPAGTFTLAQNGGISIEWVAKDVTRNSYLTIALSGVKTRHSVYCAFPGSDGKADVLEALANKMPKDTYELTAVFQSTQIHLHPTAQIPAWIITSHDWRYAKVSKI